LVGDVEPTLGEQILDVSVAQRKAQVEPHSALDDNRRKAVTAVRNFNHRASLPATSLPSHLVILTMPASAVAISLPVLTSRCRF
jgi:hypothetical protein